MSFIWWLGDLFYEIGWWPLGAIARIAAWLTFIAVAIRLLLLTGSGIIWVWKWFWRYSEYVVRPRVPLTLGAVLVIGAIAISIGVGLYLWLNPERPSSIVSVTPTATPRPTPSRIPTSPPSTPDRLTAQELLVEIRTEVYSGVTPMPTPSPSPRSIEVTTQTPLPEGAYRDAEGNIITQSLLITPTPRQPTVTFRPTSTPKRSFGPAGGSLYHDPNSNTIKLYSAGVEVANFIAEAEFFNPYSASDNSWDYGFLFRRSGGQFDIISVTSAGGWEHRFRGRGDGESDERLAAGYAGFGLDLTTRGSNQLRLVVAGTKGWLFVNGQHAGSLNFGSSVNSGDVEVATGYLTDNQVNGAVTRFEDFSVKLLARQYGPSSGSLVQEVGFLAVGSSFVEVTDAVFESRFYNPQPQQNSWSYGFLIRHQGFGIFDAVLARVSEGQYGGKQQTWYHYTRTGSAEETILLASGGLYNLKTGPRDNNHIQVIVLDDEGWLFVNDNFVTKLNMGPYGEPGDIQAFSGYFTDDDVPGAVIRLQDFSVWSP